MARGPVTSRVIDWATASPARSSHGPANGGGRDDEGTDRVIDYAEVGTSYIAMWNATDEQDRAKLVAGLCTDDARYDVAVLTDEGKVVAVYGFLDKVPAAL